MRNRLRAALFALITAGSLGFGASQALAMPAAGSECGGVPWNFPAYCPDHQLVDCSAACAGRGYYDGGTCIGNCCTCAI